MGQIWSMKLLLPLVFAMTGIGFAQDEAPQTPTDKGANQTQGVQVDPAEVTALVQKILETYKQTLVDAKPLLNGTDIQLPKELLDAETTLASLTGQATEPQPTGSQGAAAGQKSRGQGLELGTLKTGGLQTGGLPLTLPNVEPTTEPIEQYQMWRKAERDKAIRDRYLELRRMARAD